jgi:hypothetical protein
MQTIMSVCRLAGQNADVRPDDLISSPRVHRASAPDAVIVTLGDY